MLNRLSKITKWLLFQLVVEGMRKCEHKALPPGLERIAAAKSSALPTFESLFFCLYVSISDFSI